MVLLRLNRDWSVQWAVIYYYMETMFSSKIMLINCYRFVKLGFISEILLGLFPLLWCILGEPFSFVINDCIGGVVGHVKTQIRGHIWAD